MPILVWLRRDLRLADSPAIAAAATRSTAIVIVIIDDPRQTIAPTARRATAEAAAIAEITRDASKVGWRVDHRHGAPEIILQSIAAETGAKTVLANEAIGDAREWRSDRATKHALGAIGVVLTEYAHDAIRRGSETLPSSFLAPFPPNRVEGAESEAQRRLAVFLASLPHRHYARDMWKPGADRVASSLLSIDLATGALAGDRALAETAACANRAGAYDRATYAKFAARLQLRRQFRQLFEDNMAGFPTSLTRESTPLAEHLLAAWRTGQTGVPMVDAAMRDLAETGWINFRLRQTVASFALDLLALDPWDVGRTLAALFDDYDPAIHWPQIFLQAGILAPERGPRIINPVKQGRDLDPSERYVRRWLLDLTALPAGFGHEPWRYPSWRGPRPIVDLVAAARTARSRAPSKPANTAEPTLF